MTTLEIVNFICDPGDKPCDEGQAFAAAHPDPFKAIETAVASNDYEVRQFVRWAVWQKRVLGNSYTRLPEWHNEDPKLTERCADILREWLHGFLAGQELQRGEETT